MTPEMTIEAYIENGQIVLPDALPLPDGTKVCVSVREASATADANDQKWRPQTALGRRLKTLREEFIAAGGKLLSADEIDREVSDRRGQTLAEQE
jgi:hypothetical protein